MFKYKKMNKTGLAKHLENDFQKAAKKMLEEGLDKLEVGDLFLVKDGTPEYLEYGGGGTIFASFNFEGYIFYIAFD